MHYGECEEIVTRFKSFACCVETYITAEFVIRVPGESLISASSYKFHDVKFQFEKRRHYD